MADPVELVEKEIGKNLSNEMMQAIDDLFA
jgi:hypothetical protein